jgi:hypothetical protein
MARLRHPAMSGPVVANGWEADMARQPNSVENDTTLT